MYRSKFEASFAKQLEGENVSFEYEASVIGYTIPERKGKYTPDFKLLGGRTSLPVFIETKGYWDAEDRTKLKLVKEQHPDLDLRIVFMNANNKIHKKSKTTYGDWATKHGFKWANKTIPKEWIKELSIYDS